MRIVSTYWVGQKTAPFHCNNFVYSRPILIFLAHTHCRKLATGGYIDIVGPPNMACVTAKPCKIYRIKFLQGSVATQTALGGLIIQRPIANFLWCTYAKNYENWLGVDQVIAMKKDAVFWRTL